MNTREDILTFLRSNREYFKNNFRVIKIGLFGSFARNEQTPESDVDLLIEMDADALDVHRLKNEMRHFVSERCRRSVDLAREKYLRPYAKHNIMKEAIFV